MPTGVYETAIRIVAQDPQIQEGDQVATVKLVVTNQISEIFVPAIFR